MTNEIKLNLSAADVQEIKRAMDMVRPITISLQLGGQVTVSGVPQAILQSTMHFDPSDLTSITSSGGTISQINDLSGNDYHAVQATSAKQPATGTTSINGLNVMAFDQDILRAALPAGTFPSGMQVTYIWQKTGANLTFEGPINKSQTNVGSPFDWYNNRLTFASGSAAAFTDLRTLTTPTIVSYEIGTTSQRLYLNGVLSGTSALTNYVDGNPEIQIGARDDEATFCRGSIGEIVVNQGTLDSTNRTSLEVYLADKWGITL